MNKTTIFSIAVVTVLTLLGTVVLSVPRLLAASDDTFTGGGVCDPHDKDEDVWRRGFCFAFDQTSHQMLDDTFMGEIRRYAITVEEDAARAGKSFAEMRQMAIEKSDSIGSSEWVKLNPESVSIGDAGFIEIAKLPRGGYVGSTSLIPDTDNAEEGYFDRYIFNPVFLQGRCIVSGVFLGTVTHNATYKANHREEVYRDASDHPRYKLVNIRPASSYSLKEETKTVIVNDLRNLAGRLAPMCGMAKTETAPPLVGKTTETEVLIPKNFDLYEDCKSRCTVFQGTASKAYCDQRPDQESKNQCYQDLEYATEQCLHGCYINWSPEQMQLRAQEGVRISGTNGGKLSINLPTAYELALARVKGQTIEQLRKNFFSIDLPNGKQIEIDVADIPIEPPPISEELSRMSQEQISRWMNSEGTLLYDPILKKYQSLAEIQRKSTAYDPLYPQGNPGFVGPLRFDFSFQQSDKPVLLSIDPSGCCQTITFGTDSQGQPITDPGMIVTVPEAWQIIKIQNTAVAVGGNSRITLAGADSVELSQGVIEIQRPNERYIEGKAGGVFIVTTPFGSVTSEKTRFWVAHNPLKGYTLVGVREGKISITHAFTGETTTLESQENGKPGIMLLLQPEVEKQKGSAWLWIIILAFAGAIAYFTYRNKEKMIAVFRKSKPNI